MQQTLSYFFSYARADSEFVLRVATGLRTAGARLWLDQIDIVGGQRWDRAIEEALQSCEGMIVALSPDAVASNNVMDEVSYALEENKVVVPVMLRSCAIPFRLRRVQRIDLTSKYELGFAQLLRAVGLQASTQAMAPGRAQDLRTEPQDSPEMPVLRAPAEDTALLERIRTRLRILLPNADASTEERLARTLLPKRAHRIQTIVEIIGAERIRALGADQLTMECAKVFDDIRAMKYADSKSLNHALMASLRGARIIDYAGRLTPGGIAVLKLAATGRDLQ